MRRTTMKKTLFSSILLSLFSLFALPEQSGSLTIIGGSMCAGKSSRIIETVRRATLSNIKILVFKPAIDNRKMLNLEQDPLTYIPSRNGNWIDCIPVQTTAQMAEIIKKSQAIIIVIDEAHFFTPESKEFVELIRFLVESGKKVIIAGLELDFRGEPFGPMPELLAYADKVIKLTAICSKCGNDTYCLTQRLVNGQPAHYDDPLFLVGANQYEPRCRSCHIIRKDERNA